MRFLLLLFLLIGCTSGHNNPPQALPQADKLAQGKAFAYYGDCVPSCLPEVRGTVSFIHTPPWFTTYEQVEAALSSSVGFPTVLSLPDAIVYGGDCGVVSSWLDRLARNPGAASIIGFYLVDEPTLPDRPHVYSREEIILGNACVRRNLLRLNLPNRLYVIYGCHHSWDGIEQFDILACDDYGESDHDYAKDVARLKALGKPVMLVSGGACPWLHDPRGFAYLINSDPQLVGLWGFLYPDNWDQKGSCGIHSSPLRPIFDNLLFPPPV